MDDYFEMIEKKIREAGYTGKVDGEAVYDEICDQIEEKEPGSYIFMVKKEEQLIFEYKIDVMEDQFNLSYIRIQTPLQVFTVDFD